MPKVFRGGRGWCWALEEGGLTLFDPLDGLVPFVGVEATLHQIKQAIGVRENAESCDALCDFLKLPALNVSS